MNLMSREDLGNEIRRLRAEAQIAVRDLEYQRDKSVRLTFLLERTWDHLCTAMNVSDAQHRPVIDALLKDIHAEINKEPSRD